ncbi:MAG: hypothetical protein HRT71_01065 [Flavobacteriales bacterium]|nr:hypothetical protein [Flavobacteriales bacterium]
MIANQNIVKRLPLVVMLLLLMFNINAAETDVLIGSQITTSTTTTITVKDNLFPTSGYTTWLDDNDIRYHQLTNLVTLSIDHDNSTVIPSYVLDVELSITYQDESGVQQPAVTKVLTIEHGSVSGPYTDKNAYAFSGGHQVEVTITKITKDGTEIDDAPDNVKLESAIKIDRLLVFNFTDIPSAPTSILLSPSNEIQVSWSSILGATEYHLEWLYVNNYHVSGNARDEMDLYFDFNQNATRVAITGTSYNITHVFGAGHVLFRVRGATYNDTKQHLLAGKWSCHTDDCEGKVSTHGSTYDVITAHEGDRINYIYNVDYAEDGKKTELVSYFDGILKKVQTVGKINSVENPIVFETFYDHQGRPAIQTLPVPSEGFNLGFYPNFNLNLMGMAYDRDNFDLDPGDCSIAAEAMSTNSGSSKYYSVNNSDKAGAQAFVPDASGYPFSHIEYEPDNTGRVRKKGSPGPNHQLSSTASNSHEMKYFYGKPSQENLNKIFGQEVGVASHYKKDLVIDANGQGKVAYMDMEGRIIATSLAGNTPFGMAAIPSNLQGTPDDMKISVIDKQGVGNNTRSLTSTFHHLVTTAGEHNFNYKLEGATFNDMDALPVNVCLECIYDIEIDVQDECGDRPAFTNSPGFGSLPIKVTLGTLDDLCLTTDEDFSVNFKLDFNVGKYVISRKLSINREARDQRVVTYTSSLNTTLITLEEMIENQVASLDFSECEELDCRETCLIDLGDDVTPEGLASCVLDCELTGGCDQIEGIMIGDMYPASQYGEYIATDDFDGHNIVGVDYHADDVTSIFYNYASGNARYQSASITYKNLDGTESLFPSKDVDGEDILITAQELSIGEFIENFEGTWAEELVKYHPEWCHLEHCKANTLSNKFDFLVRSVDTYQEALSLGLLYPLNLTPDATVPSFGNPNGIWPIDGETPYKDPFFKAGSLGAGYEQEMFDFLTVYTVKDFDTGDETFLGTTWGIATLVSGLCTGYTLETQCNDALDAYSYSPFMTTDPCTRDKMWAAFRGLYLWKKNELFEKARDEFLTAQGTTLCPNYNIGTGSGNYSEKTKRFPTVTEGLGDFSHVLEEQPDVDGAVSDIQDSISKFCEESAEGNADRWMQLLTGCAPDPTIWLDTEEAIEADIIPDPNYAFIKEGFVAIFLANCSDAQPYGASTMAPGTSVSVDVDGVTKTYTSFQDVLEEILDVDDATELNCNADLITHPGPFDHEPDVAGDFKRVDTCACDNILTVDDEYYNLSPSEMPAGVTNIEQYFAYVNNGVGVDGFTSKVCACNDAFAASGEEWAIDKKWSEEAQTALTLTPEFVPNAIGCIRCLQCEEVTDIFDLFIEEAELEYELLLDETGGEEKEQLMTIIRNRLNNELNLNKSFIEYEEFVTDCDLFDEGTSVCTEASVQAVNLQTLISYLTHPAEIPTTNNGDPKSCITTLPYEPGLPDELQEFLDGDCNSATAAFTLQTDGSFTLHLEGCLTSCQVDFAIVETGYDIEKLVPRITNIRPDDTQQPVDEYAFLADGYVINEFNENIAITLQGTTTCFPITSCADDKDDITLCNDQLPGNYDQDDCKNTMIDYAVYEAENQYDIYIDSVRNQFESLYNKQCIAVVDNETHTMEYTDNEHHFMLYYYDQAGNRVRTIPPAGFEPVDSELWDDIDAARENGTRVVYTKHRMATKYKYNSLNKLITQYSPDEDSFNDFNVDGTGSGLKTGMDVATVTFSDANNGVLFGDDPQQAGRSLIYTTTDGGVNWQAISDIGVKNINATFAVSSSVFAVGQEGTVIRSDDNGSTWTIVNTGSTANFVAVYFSSDVQNGLIFTEGGAIIRTADGGASWDFPTSSLSNLSTLKKVVFSTDNYALAVGTKSGKGAIYVTQNAQSSPPTWTLQQDYSTLDLQDVMFANTITSVNSTDAFALGQDGTLIKTSNAGSTWRKVNTNSNVNFKQVHFTSGSKGLLVSTSGALYTTSNGGGSLSTLSVPSGATVRELFLSHDNTGFGLTTNNRVFGIKSDLTLKSGSTDIGSISSIQTVYFEDDQIGYAAGANGAFLQTVDGGLTWATTFSGTLGNSISIGNSLSGSIIKMHIVDGEYVTNVVSTNPTTETIVSHPLNAKGFAINTLGEMFSTSTNLNVWAPITVDSDPPDFFPIDFYFTSNLAGYLLSDDGQLASTTDGGVSWQLETAITTATLTFKSIGFEPNGAGIAVGTNGTIFSKSASGTNWTDNTNDLTPLDLNSISVNGSNAIAVGEGGTVFLQQSTGSTWETVVTGISSELTASTMESSSTVVIAGTSGLVKRTSSITSPSWTPIYGISATISDITNASGDGLAVTENGAVYLSTSLSSHSAFSAKSSGNENLNAITIIGSVGYAVGDKGELLRSSNLSSWDSQGDDIKPARVTATTTAPGGTMYSTSETGIVGRSYDKGASWVFDASGVSNLNSIYFIDADNGIAVGDQSIAKTDNGGNSWSVISGAGTDTYQDVFLLSIDRGFIVGQNNSGEGVIKQVDLDGSSISDVTPATPTLDPLNSVHFAGIVGYIAGNNGALLKTENGNEPGSAVWGVLEATNDDDWVAYTDPLNSTNTVDLNDIQCIDITTVYAVGNGGVIIKSIDGGVSWTRRESGTSQNLEELSFKEEGEAILSGANKSARQLVDHSDQFSNRFFYDILGNMVASQNSQQYHADPQKFSYTKYDELNRVVEVGELSSNTQPYKKLLNSPQFPNNWSSDKSQVVTSYYDLPINETINTLFDGGQNAIRNRVATTTYEEISDGDRDTYDHGTHFSYDVHGNVITLIQDNPSLEHLHQRYKKVTYEFDLISNNVTQIKYQAGESDQFYHKYMYDGDNRIIGVMTSSDGHLWDNDASYQYNKHGMLARMEIGDLKVQGIDYAYTLQGWIKGVNSNTLVPKDDMGADGKSGDSNENVAKDAFGYGLTYYSGDYQAINPAVKFLATVDLTPLGIATGDLYNGNISKMVTALSPIAGGDMIAIQGMAYGYDQLNRIVSANAFQDVTASVDNIISDNSFLDASSNGDYSVALSYDGNGNINTLNRNGYSDHSEGKLMDDLTYHYELDVNGNRFNNRLSHVNDEVDKDNYDESDDSYTSDIDNQGTYVQKNEATHNYRYDERGNLTQDLKENIEEIEWTVRGQVKRITRTSGLGLTTILFKYDAMGNRVSKAEFYNVATGTVDIDYTHYVRDAGGNVLAVYKQQQSVNATEGFDDRFSLHEHHMFGEDRLGLKSSVQLLHSGNYKQTGINSFDERISGDAIQSLPETYDGSMVSRDLGEKNFEMTNQLNNVLVVVTDKKLVNTTGTSTFVADIVSVSDYYPFGMTQPGRTQTTNSYRYGFQGQEKDDEIKGIGNSINYKYRMHDPRIGRFFAVDPLAAEYPWNSPYAFSENRVISAIELEGLETHDVAQVENGQQLAASNTVTGPAPANPDIGVKVNYQIYNSSTNSTKFRSEDIYNTTGTPNQANLPPVIEGPYTYQSAVAGGPPPNFTLASMAGLTVNATALVAGQIAAGPAAAILAPPPAVVVAVLPPVAQPTKYGGSAAGGTITVTRTQTTLRNLDATAVNNIVTISATDITTPAVAALDASLTAAGIPHAVNLVAPGAMGGGPFAFDNTDPGGVINNQIWVQLTFSVVQTVTTQVNTVANAPAPTFP